MAMTTTNKQHFHLNAHAHKRSAVLMFLFFFAIQVGAQDFSSTSAYRAQRDMQPQMVQSSGYQTYQSTIYEPFSNEMPGNNNPSITGRKNEAINPGDEGEWGENSDGGDQENSFPIGEPWIMLVFAAMAAVVITLRKKQTA